MLPCSSWNSWNVSRSVGVDLAATDLAYRLVPDECLYEADDAIGRDDHKAHQQEADDQQIDRRGNGDGRELLQRSEEHRADQRADPAGGAADQRHGDGVDRVVEAERRGRLQEADII